MPLHWIIDSRAELVSVVAEGDVSLSDAMAFLRTLTGAKVHRLSQAVRRP